MNIKMNGYFTTGEFAKLCNVSKHTLFHYDKIGLFSPELTDEKGYRYYSVSQYDVFDVISILKELGMPLKDIKEYLDNRSPDGLIDILKNQEKIIENKIWRLQKINTLVKNKIEVTEKALNINEDIIYHKEINEPVYYAASEEVIETYERAITIYIANLINLCNRLQIYSHYALIGTRRKEDIYKGHYEKYYQFCIRVDKPYEQLQMHIKPAGHYIETYHFGGFDNIAKSYDRLLKYGIDNKLKFKGYFYEETILDELSVKGEAEYLIKISVQLENIDNSDTY